MTDQDLVHALRSSRVRPADAYARLYDAYGEELYRQCWRILGDIDTAQTVLRDTFIVARAHIDRLGDSRRLREWLTALARAECARHPQAVEADDPDRVRTGPDDPPQPPCLRLRVLSGVAGPDLSGYRAHIAERADSFDRKGFPVPAAPRRTEGLLHQLLPGVIVGACALLILVLVLLVIARTQPEHGTWVVPPAHRMTG